MHTFYAVFLLNFQFSGNNFVFVLDVNSRFLEFFKFMLMIMRIEGTLAPITKLIFQEWNIFWHSKGTAQTIQNDPKILKKFLELTHEDWGILSKSIWVNWCHLWNFLTFYCHFCVSDKSNILDFMSLSWALELSVKPAHHGLNCCCLSPPTMTRKMRQSDGWALRT